MSFSQGLSSVACPSCLVGQCHNSQFVSWPSHQILMFCTWVSHGKVVTSKFSLYLLVWMSLCILLILFFKPSFCNGPETELKWKTDIEKLYNICMLSFADSWCLVPFSSNISWDCKHNVRLCYDHRGKRFIYQSPNNQFRAEYTASNLLYEACHHKQNSCNSNAYQSEWGFRLEWFSCLA